MQLYIYKTRLNQPQYVNTPVGTFSSLKQVDSCTFFITANDRPTADKMFFTEANKKFTLLNTKLDCEVDEINIESLLSELQRLKYPFPQFTPQIQVQEEKKEDHKTQLKFSALALRDNFCKSKEEKQFIDKIIKRII